MSNSTLEISNLLDLVKELRSEKGCPWDMKQTSESLVKHIKEEVAELLDAIEKKDTINICEESGDVLFLLVMLAEIHSEKNMYQFQDTVSSINEKLIRRHPHVFGDSKIKDEEGLRKQWNDIKAEEKLKKIV